MSGAISGVKDESSQCTKIKLVLISETRLTSRVYLAVRQAGSRIKYI